MIEVFTYQDYLEYQEFLKETAKHTELQEQSETYDTSKQTVNHEHDKIFRKILDNKKEAVKLINKVLKLKTAITENEIEKYNSSFVTLELKNQECDIIYKIKSKNIFFLIEHQTRIDYTMLLRILEYENEIMKSAIDKKKLGKKEYRLPKVISIVLYSGRKRWNVKSAIQEVQEKLEGYAGIEFARYNVVDINNYTEEELLQEESFLSKALLIEKARYTDSLPIYLEKIIQELNRNKTIYTQEQKELLITIINLALSKKLEEVGTKEFIKKLREEEKPMLAVLEMIEEENKKIFRDGRKEGEKRGKKQAKLEDAKKMLEKGMNIKTVMEITELKEAEIKKLLK